MRVIDQLANRVQLVIKISAVATAQQMHFQLRLLQET
jgi:hypothetical protein